MLVQVHPSPSPTPYLGSPQSILVCLLTKWKKPQSPILEIQCIEATKLVLAANKGPGEFRPTILGPLTIQATKYTFLVFNIFKSFYTFSSLSLFTCFFLFPDKNHIKCECKNWTISKYRVIENRGKQNCINKELSIPLFLDPRPFNQQFLLKYLNKISP